MFFVVNHTKSFMKPDYSVIQSSAITDFYKWGMSDMLSGKTVFSTVGPSYNEL